MVSNALSFFITLQFLESTRREVCNQHMDNYKECCKDKRMKFQQCYILHMQKYENCMKSLEIIKNLDKNDY
jgi:hypothetical protein